jgi:hypothetical protein
MLGIFFRGVLAIALISAVVTNSFREFAVATAIFTTALFIGLNFKEIKQKFGGK